MHDTPRCFGILGDPVDHSLSPTIHNAAFQAQRLHCVYIPLHVSAKNLKRALTAMTLADIEGANVTTPHKQTIIPYLDALDASAKTAGAVNTIYKKGKRWIGANTDGVGFLMACKQRRVTLKGKTVTILGAGGVASAIMAKLAKSGVRHVVILNRSIARARRLKNQFQTTRMTTEVAVLSAASYRQFFPKTDILVHATSQGMAHSPALVTPLHLLPRKAAVCDCQYKRGSQTTLITQATRRSHKVVNGLDLLLAQAAESYRLWTGRRAPLATMRRAAERHRSALNLV